MYPQSYVLSKNKKNIQNFSMKIFNFYKLRKISILHGHVFVMPRFLYMTLPVVWDVKVSTKSSSENVVRVLFSTHLSEADGPEGFQYRK